MLKTCRVISILFLAFVCIFSTGKFNPLMAEDKIVAVVNDEAITQKDLNDFLTFMRVQLSQEHQGKVLEEKMNSLKHDLLERLIEDRLILQEANKSKINLDESRVKVKLDELKKRYDSDTKFQADLMHHGLTQGDLEKKIREQFLMFNIVEQKVRSKIIVRPNEVTEFYENNKNQFENGGEKTFDCFALESEDLAKTFAYNLKRGEKMENLAARYPVTVNKLNVMKGDELKKDIEDAVSKLELNEVSEPVHIEDKYYVFRLLSIGASRQLSLSEVQDKIRSFLFEKKLQEGLSRWLNDLKKQAYINITQN